MSIQFRQSHGQGAVSPHRRRTSSTTEGTVPLPCCSPVRRMSHASPRSCRRLPCPPTGITYRPGACGSRGRGSAVERSSTTTAPHLSIHHATELAHASTPPSTPLLCSSSTQSAARASPEPALPPPRVHSGARSSVPRSSIPSTSRLPHHPSLASTPPLCPSFTVRRQWRSP